MKWYLFLVISLFLLVQCSPRILKDPSATLRETGRAPSVHLQAMVLLDTQVGIDDPNYHEALQRMLWVYGYSNKARLEALNRLWAHDRESTTRILRQLLPRMKNWSWLTELCAWIGSEKVVELNEALISSWSRPTSAVVEESERPEYKALVEIVGEDDILDVAFDSLIASNEVRNESYRIRCWDLLQRLDQSERLVELLKSSSIDSDDVFLHYLQRSMYELGIVPENREEILWIKELSNPAYAKFWNEARETLKELSQDKRNNLEMRNIPIVVSLRRHGGEDALSRTANEIITNIENQISGQKHYEEREGGGGYTLGSELLERHKSKLTWGDAIAIEIALKAMAVPQVRSHLFDYAVRDHEDETTEYGGIISLDKKGRFEILEFEPKIRSHDRKYNAPQELFDASYTALFHFHFHAQEYRNGEHAGPGMGDKSYATNTRANCLVFTFVNSETMNVDYYRHSGVVIDLGTITR